jgi:hypothetical protein
VLPLQRVLLEDTWGRGARGWYPKEDVLDRAIGAGEDQLCTSRKTLIGGA